MAVCDALNADDERGYWLLDMANDGIIMRNYHTGAALMSSLETSVQWSLAEVSDPAPNKSAMTFEWLPGGWVLQPLLDGRLQQGYAHEAAGKKVVSWGTGAQATLWNMTPVSDITPEEIEAKRRSWSYVIKAWLDELFADNICTELKPAYAAMSSAEIQQTEAYAALPEALQKMVMKVHSGNWAETDPVNPAVEWDNDHARKFRVQMIEPYSECDQVSALTCIQAYTNFNNITGIIGDAGNTIYVMVEKGAPEGATLYIAGRTPDDDVNTLNHYADGYELHEGLNVIKCEHDNSQMVIYYTVKTNDGRTRVRPLTAFDDIKVHIEGGSINGFFNTEGDALYTPDTNEDWFYYRDRARHQRFCLISKHCILYFHFLNVFNNDNNELTGLKNLLTREEYDAGNFDLRATMKAWDDMFVAELLVMGLMPDDIIQAEKDAGRDWYDLLENDEIAPSDYSLYFNNRLMGISSPSGYMSATWYRTTYNVSTFRSIIMDFPTMDLWGPAHEFGHMNQGPMKIVGTTEESNNVFSNIALFYRGDKASRAALPSEQFAGFNSGYNFYQHGTWGTTRMWFQLWLYYHATGHNKKFYPRLYELLRQNPLDHTAYAHINSKDDLLHFAKMCCMAAGEDLTDFFDAWGFFTPLDDYFIDDYAQYHTYLSQEEIDQWKAEIAEMAAENGWKKNNAIIFIDDRVGSDRAAYDNSCRPEDAGSMGGLKDFAAGSGKVSGNYEFTINGTTVDVSGATGGVGFIIYDENGKLIGFSNDSPFNVSPEAARTIAEGKAVFCVMEGDNEEVEVTDVIRRSGFDTQSELLTQALAKAEELLTHTDFANRMVGYLKPELVNDLKQVHDSVKTLVDNNMVTAGNIVDVWTALSLEIIGVESLALNADNTIGIIPGRIYTFVANKGRTTVGGMKASADGAFVDAVAAADVNPEILSQQWIFTLAPQDDDQSAAEGYYIQNVDNHKYINLPEADETETPLSVEPQKFIVEIHSPGYVSLAADVANVSHKALHAAGDAQRIVRWQASNEASQWTLQLTDFSDLRDLIDETRSLADELGTNVETITPVALGVEHYSTNAEYTGKNTGDRLSSWEVLFDGDKDTYFHSNYDGNTTDKLDHHIRIQLPEPTVNDETHMILTYTTRNNSISTYAPVEAVIEYSADGEKWTTAQELDVVMPITHATAFESETFEVPAETAYIRFTVTKSRQSATNSNAGVNSGHAYFAVSEFGLSTYEVVSVPDSVHYPDSNAKDIIAALRQCRNSEIVANAPNVTASHHNASFAALLPHYQTLLAIKSNTGDPTAIGETGASAGRPVIFDLQGRRLDRVAAPGIYIVNGKKIYCR